jgi:hypothetical protein
MITKRFRIFRALFLAPILPALFAGPPPAAIGVVISDGSFQMNNAPSTGSASVADGSSVVTGPTGASIRFSGGGRAMFGVDSRGTVYSDHLVLDQGSARIVGYSATANTLRISAIGNASASLLLTGKVVRVTALAGNVRVFSSEGVDVANLVPGLTLNILAPKPGLATSSSLTGCVFQNGDRYEITDEISRVTAELRGGNLSPGEKIRVTGVALPGLKSPDGLSQVLKVTKVTRVGGTCKVLPDVPDTDVADVATAGSAVAVAGTVGDAAVATVGAASGIGTDSIVAGAAVAAGATAAVVGVALKSSPATLSNQ